MNDVAAQISAAFAEIQQGNVEAAFQERFNAAQAIVATIPSGTRDEDLTPKQTAALDEYDRCLLYLREVQAWREVQA